MHFNCMTWMKISKEILQLDMIANIFSHKTLELTTGANDSSFIEDKSGICSSIVWEYLASVGVRLVPCVKCVCVCLHV